MDLALFEVRESSASESDEALVSSAYNLGYFSQTGAVSEQIRLRLKMRKMELEAEKKI